MSEIAYRLPDEPAPGKLQQLAVNPLWPLLGVMFCGSWLAFPWFAINGFALGSATRIRELIIAVSYFLGACLVVVFLSYCVAMEWLPEEYLKYALQILVLWKLGLAYWLFFLQPTALQLYKYIGGTVRNGVLLLVFAAIFLRERVLALSDFGLWILVMS